MCEKLIEHTCHHGKMDVVQFYKKFEIPLNREWNKRFITDSIFPIVLYIQNQNNVLLLLDNYRFNGKDRFGIVKLYVQWATFHMDWQKSWNENFLWLFFHAFSIRSYFFLIFPFSRKVSVSAIQSNLLLQPQQQQRGDSGDDGKSWLELATWIF